MKKNYTQSSEYSNTQSSEYSNFLLDCPFHISSKFVSFSLNFSGFQKHSQVLKAFLLLSEYSRDKETKMPFQQQTKQILCSFSLVSQYCSHCFIRFLCLHICILALFITFCSFRLYLYLQDSPISWSGCLSLSISAMPLSIWTTFNTSIAQDPTSPEIYYTLRGFKILLRCA